MLYKILRKEPVIILFLFIVTFVVYSLSLKGSFLYMDDIETVVKSPLINGSLSQAVKTLDVVVVIDNLIARMFGLTPVPFHVTSVIVHFLNTLLIFYISKQLFGKKVAAIVATLFAVHPANTEAVSWISANVYLYRTFFWLLTLFLFILYKEKRKLFYLIASYLLAIIYSISSKTAWIVTLPLLLTAIDAFIINSRYSLVKAKLIIPYYLTAAYYLVFFFFNSFKERVRDLQTYYVGVAPQNRIISIMRVIKNSFELYIFPYRLNILFGDFEPSALNILLLFLFVALLVYLLIYFYKNDRKLFGLLLCVYISILPLFSPISIGLGYAERYFYFGTFFFSLFIVLFVLNIEKIYKKKDLTLIIFGLLIMLFSIRTMVRTLDWKDDRSIWTSAQRASPNSYEVYNELGNIYYREDNLPEALKQYQKALEIRPNYPEVIHNVGLVYIKAGQFELAKTFLNRSLEMNPYMYESYYRLGQIAAFERDYDMAAKYFTESLKINPEFTKARAELAKLQ